MMREAIVTAARGRIDGFNRTGFGTKKIRRSIPPAGPMDAAVAAAASREREGSGRTGPHLRKRRSDLLVTDTGPHTALLLTEFAPTLARLLDTHALLQADHAGRNVPGPPL